MIFQDQTGRSFKINKTPQRIISLVPSQTELVVALGLKDSLVGITKFCEYPVALKKSKTIVGGTKKVHITKIKELKPDLILCNKEENTLEMVEELEKITAVHVSNIKTISDNLQLINQYGKLFGCAEKAGLLITQIKEAKDDFCSQLKNTEKQSVLYVIWKEPLMAAGGDTFINAMLEESNFTNVLKQVSRYPEVDLKNSNTKEVPQLVFLSSEPYPFKEKHQKELAKYFPESSILLVDGTYFSWFGSRPIKAYGYFKKLQKQIQAT